MPSWMEVLRSHESHSNSRDSPPMRHPITPVLGDIRLPKLGLGKTQPGGYPMAGFDTENAAPEAVNWSIPMKFMSVYIIYHSKKNPHPTFGYAQPKIFEPPLRPHVSRWLKWNHTYHTFLLVKTIFHRSSIPSFGHFQSLSLKWDGSKPWYPVNPKIAGKWMFIPLKMVLIGIDPYPNRKAQRSKLGKPPEPWRMSRMASTCQAKATHGTGKWLAPRPALNGRELGSSSTRAPA